MAARARSRSRFRVGTAGRSRSGSFNGTTPDWINQTPHIVLQESMADVVGNPRGMNTLTHIKDETRFTPLNGKWPITGGKFTTWDQYDNFEPGWVTGAGAGADTIPLTPEESAVTLIARTNPSRPTVDLPTAIAELKDFPGMIRDLGKMYLRAKARGQRQFRPSDAYSVAGDNASLYLGYQFGIAPLINDLQDLWKFQEHYEKKLKVIRRLHSKGGYRTGASLGTHELRSEPVNQYTNRAGSAGSIRYQRTRATSKKVWGAVHWLPDVFSMPSVNDDEKYRELATRAVLGLTLDASSAWELMPWSWLIDYFTNAGDYLMAGRNVVGAFPAEHCICAQTTTTNTWSRLPDNFTGITGGGGWATTQRRERFIGANFPFTATSSMLTARQVSILGALSVAKLAR